MNGDASITISDGLFDGVVVNKGRYGSLSITGGLFTKDVDVYTISTGNLSITGGYFVAKLSCRKAATPALPLCAIRMAEPSKCL